MEDSQEIRISPGVEIIQKIEERESELEVNRREFEAIKQQVTDDIGCMRNEWMEKLERVKKFHLIDDVVSLNVGGSVFKISAETLKSIPNTFFCQMFNKEVSAQKSSSDGSYFIDRSPFVMDRILEYYREKSFTVFDKNDRYKMQMIYEDAVFYNILPIVNNLQQFNYQLLDSPGKTLHLSNQDHYSPVTASIYTDMKEIRNISDGCFDGYDCVLVTVWSNVDSKKLGDMLADYVDRGGNVVICLFANTTSYNHCGGRFSDYNPFKLESYIQYSIAHSLGEYDMNHRLMKGVNTLRQTDDTRRVIGNIESGGVDVVARWNDGSRTPMISIRYDKPGMITSIGMCCASSHASGDVIQLLRNAMCVRKRFK